MNVKQVSKNKETIFGYSSVENNDILTIQCTESNIFVLLNNGKIISWGKNNAALGRKCFDANVDSYIPKFIKMEQKIKFVEISCGINYCLARGNNFVVYSWGYNTHGQVC
jgi:alpha-tubulin suppressor-like RCC1 family protein